MAVKLTALGVKALNKPGRYGDGGGLYLQVRDAQHRSCLFRYKIHGQTRHMGLGATSDVSLAEGLALPVVRIERKPGVPLIYANKHRTGTVIRELGGRKDFGTLRKDGSFHLLSKLDRE